MITLRSVLLLAPLVCFACGGEDGDPPAKPYSVRFAAVVGDEPFACGREYTGIGTSGATMTPVDLRVYVHDVKLVDAQGEEAALELETNDYQSKNVALLDFEDGSGGCDQGDATTHLSIKGVAPENDYAGVKFKLGIPLELNHVAVDRQAPPLNKTSLFWDWRLGHIFLAAVTRAEVGTSTVTNDHFTHVGSTACTGDPEMGLPVTTCAKPNRGEYTLNGDLENDDILLDLKAIKTNADITAGVGCHSFDAASCSGMFDSLGIDFATGAPKPSQSVFRMPE